MIKRIFIIIPLLILSLVILSYSSFIRLMTPSFCTINGADEVRITDYLKNNKTELSPGDSVDFKSLSLLDSELENHEVFLSGEAHAIRNNLNAQFYLLKYFNQKANVRYLLTEQGYGASQLINKYLETGNKDYIDIIYSELKGTASWNKESADFWVELYKYNLGLPENKKITVLGADIEHQSMTAFRYLYEILPKSIAPDNISKNIETLRKNYRDYSLVYNSFASTLDSDIQKCEEDYKLYLKDNFFDFKYVTENIINKEKAYGSQTNMDGIREEAIINNFKKLYNHYPKGKFYGEWGLEHTYLKDHGGMFGRDNCFATYINNAFQPTQGKVLSIANYYINSRSMTYGKTYGEEKVEEVAKIDILKKLSTSDYTLFKFDGSNSPFGDKPFFVNSPKGGSTKDYYQYGLLISNSPPATPYREPN